MDTVSQLLFLAVVTVIILRFVVLTSRGMPERGIISSLGCIMYVMCLFVSAQLQAAGLTGTKLLSAHALPPTSAQEVGPLTLAWSIELTIVLVAEIVANLLRRRGASFSPLSEDDSTFAQDSVQRHAATLLIVVGLIANFAFATALEDRANGGQGAFTILKTCLTVGLSILAFNKFFERPLYYLLGLLGIVFLIAISVRSPLLAIAIAFFAGRLARREMTLRALSLYAALGLVLAIMGATMSTYRSNVIRGQNADFGEALTAAVQNPFVAIYGGGIDTLDGYRLSAEVQPREPARPGNILVAVTTFVPRALWPDKPNDLSLEITNRYLGWNQGGIFLSLIGYLRLAFGGYIAALLALAALMVVTCSLYIRKFERFSGFVIMLIVFRLFLGGSPFDVYYGLVFLMIYGAGCLPFTLYRRVRR